MRLRKIARKLLKHVNLNIRIRQNNLNVSVPLISGMGVDNLKASHHEKFMSKLLQELYTGRGTFLDIGVNVGQTLIKFKSLFPAEGYIGIEPNPNCLFYVQNLIKKNNFKKCSLIACGIMDDFKLLSLNYGNKIHNETASGATFIPEYKSDRKPDKTMILPCASLDEILKMAPAENYIELIKIDVEGAELDALKGMKTTLRKYKPSIIFESLPEKANIPIRELSNIEIVQLLESLDYEIYEIQYLQDKEKVELHKISCLGFKRDQKSTNNFLAKPKELKNNQ